MPSVKSEMVSKRRTDLRKELWPNDRAWVAAKAVGFFQAPRTLPLLLSLIKEKSISGKKDAGSVYLELWARHWGQGIIEISNENEHAFASGYRGTRAVRTWRERMRILEAAGFIKIKSSGNSAIGVILLVHPMDAVEDLRRKGKVPENWLTAYAARRSATGEQDGGTAKVVRLRSASVRESSGRAG
jgi:hypothetical protein